MKRWIIALAALALTGCAHYTPQPLLPAKTAAQLEARRLDDPGLKSFFQGKAGCEIPWPKTNWDFEELTLVAFYFHPSLEVARAQWLVAQAGVKTAGARPNPSLTVTPGYDSQIPDNPSPWLVTATLDVPVETAGKRGKRVAEAEKVAESARWDFVSAVWRIRSGVRASLVDFKTSGRRVKLLQEEFTAQKEIVRLLQQRLDEGEISRPEVTTARLALNRMQLDLSDAQSKHADARSRLAGALGLGERALDGEQIDFDFSTGELEGLTSRDARRTALCSRADILGALADYAAADADLRLQVARQYPDVHLGPGYAWNAGSAGDNQWSLGLTLDLPVFDQNQGPIAEAEARRKLAAAKFSELQSQVIGEIDRAVAGFRVARAQLQTGEKLVEAQNRQQQSAEDRIRTGDGDRLDVLSAQLETADAALTQLDNEANLQTALGALEDAVQSPLTLSPDVIRATQNNSSNQIPK